MAKKVGPRKVVSRDDYYMGLAWWIRTRSKDPHTRVGCIIVSTTNEPLSVGYNGPPKQFRDEDIDWSRSEKGLYIYHAEKNAMARADKVKMSFATLYITAMPCRNCILDIVSSGISKVIYFPVKVPDPESSIEKDKEESISVAKKGGVTLTAYAGNLSWMRDEIKDMERLGVFGI